MEASIEHRVAVTGLRETLLWFAEAMEAKLRKNDHKGGWLGPEFTTDDAMKRLGQEADELRSELAADCRRGCCPSPEHRLTPEAIQRIVGECADVANFAMMIADRVRRGML